MRVRLSVTALLYCCRGYIYCTLPLLLLLVVVVVVLLLLVLEAKSIDEEKRVPDIS